jgi:hypothetical protein
MEDTVIVGLMIFVILIIAGFIGVFLFHIITGKSFWPSFKKMVGCIIKWI